MMDIAADIHLPPPVPETSSRQPHARAPPSPMAQECSAATRRARLDTYLPTSKNTASQQPNSATAKDKIK